MSDRMEAAVEFARQAEREGDIGLARSRFETGLYGMRTPADAGWAARLLRWVGTTHRAQGDHTAALDCLRASVEAAKRHGQPDDVAHALNWMGIVHQDAGRLRRSDRCFERARRWARRAGDRRAAAMIDQNLGINCNIRGDLAGALFHYRRSLRSYEAMGEEAFRAGVLNVLGMLHTDRRDWHAAERDLGRAAEIAAAGKDMRTLAMVHVNRTEMYVLRGMADQARAACASALDVGRSLNQPMVMAEILRWQGVLAREAGAIEEAESRLRDAMAIAKAHDGALLEGEIHRELGLLFWRQERGREALAALLSARRIFTGISAARDLADVAQQMGALERAFLHIVREWAESIEETDAYTHGHCHRVAMIAVALAREAGIDEAVMTWFQMGAYLHDVGKIEVPLTILNKPGKLDPAEWEIMKSHTTAGDAIVTALDFPWDLRLIVRHHHEHWDGSGYPDRLAGEAIPLVARILTIADVYDALTSDRPYRRAYGPEQALAIKADEMCCRELDPSLFEMFRTMVRVGTVASLLAA